MPAAIVVENLSKRYRIRHEPGGRAAYKTLREELGRLAQVPWNWLRRKDRPQVEDFWALKDVSFEIHPGEVVGVVGRNGAGKSTLLKILSRISPPTSGRVRMRGRVGSLLEVGTGFHPELTGRENVFLSGSILGMSRREIQRKFHDIVAFAEVEKFLDTPVKRFSSGMYVRLAFAVASHLNPQILLIDEVLAVGDSEFQVKCLGMIRKIANDGRTILLVSHNMESIKTFCKKTLVLKNGAFRSFGPTHDVLDDYLNENRSPGGELVNPASINDSAKVRIRGVRLTDHEGVVKSDFDYKEQVRAEITFEIILAGEGYQLALQVDSLQSGCIFCTSFFDQDPKVLFHKSWQRGLFKALVALPARLLRGGDYIIKVAATIPSIEVLDSLKEELWFRITESDTPITHSGEGRLGAVMPILEWKLEDLHQEGLEGKNGE